MVQDSHTYPPDVGGSGVPSAGAELVHAHDTKLELERAASKASRAGDDKAKDVEANPDAELNALASLPRLRKNILFTCFVSSPQSVALHCAHPSASPSSSTARVPPPCSS